MRISKGGRSAAFAIVGAGSKPALFLLPLIIFYYIHFHLLIVHDYIYLLINDYGSGRVWNYDSGRV